MALRQRGAADAAAAVEPSGMVVTAADVERACELARLPAELLAELCTFLKVWRTWAQGDALACADVHMHRVSVHIHRDT